VPWHQRRVIPVGSYIIAAEEQDTTLIQQLFATDQVFCDSRRMMYYYRTSPDGRRVIYSGCTSAGETGTQISAIRLRRDMCRLFSALEGTSIAHS
jgi:glycine/D-amino acid oxidase-like deaminating enzyme